MRNSRSSFRVRSGLVRGALVAALSCAASAIPAAAQMVTIYGGQQVMMAAPTGTLQVDNNSGEPLNVYVDNRLLGTAQLGVNAFGNVFAGRHVIQLTNAQGVVRSLGRFFLPMGGLHSWTVASPQLMVQTVNVFQQVNPMAFGAVQVENRLPFAINVLIGGRRYGTLAPTQTAVYYSVPPGMQQVTAYNLYAGGQEAARQTINVMPGARQYVNILPPFGTVRVINARGEPIQVTIDGQLPTWVQPGQTIDVPNVAPGNRSLNALVNGVGVQDGAALVYSGQVYAWYVRAATATIRVVNRLFEAVNLSINGVAVGSILPGQERYLMNLATDSPRRLIATDMNGLMKSAADLPLMAGETRLWVVNPQ